MPAARRRRQRMVLPQLCPNRALLKKASRAGKVALRIRGKDYLFPKRNRNGLLQGIGYVPDIGILSFRLVKDPVAKTLRVRAVDERTMVEKEELGLVGLEINPKGPAALDQQMLGTLLHYRFNAEGAGITHADLDEKLRGRGIGAFMIRQADRHFRSGRTKGVRIIVTKADIARALEKVGYKVSLVEGEVRVAEKPAEGERFNLNDLHVIPVLDPTSGKEKFYISVIRKKKQ